MNVPKPSSETVRSPDWIAAAVVLIGALCFMYLSLFRVSFEAWLKPDYSHGFLVPIFSAYLIYRAWPEAPRKLRWPNLWGLAFVSAGLLIFAIVGITNLAKEWFQGLSL